MSLSLVLSPVGGDHHKPIIRLERFHPGCHDDARRAR